jgi:REP element-mobilizing transposase RayT
VWGTKNRRPILNNELCQQVCEHIKQNAKSQGIFIDTINGHTDHLHTLMSLRADLCIKDQMQLINGESSHWINESNLVKDHFGWASEYFVESVSPDQMPLVRAYINNQQEHHRKITFQEE